MTIFKKILFLFFLIGSSIIFYGQNVHGVYKHNSFICNGTFWNQTTKIRFNIRKDSSFTIKTKSRSSSNPKKSTLIEKGSWSINDSIITLSILKGGQKKYYFNQCALLKYGYFYASGKKNSLGKNVFASKRIFFCRLKKSISFNIASIDTR